MSPAGFYCYRVNRAADIEGALIVIALPPSPVTHRVAEVFTVRGTPCPRVYVRRITLAMADAPAAAHALHRLVTQAHHQAQLDLPAGTDIDATAWRWQPAELHQLVRWPVKGTDHPLWALHDRTGCPLLREAAGQYLQPSQPWRLRRQPLPTTQGDAATLGARSCH